MGEEYLGMVKSFTTEEKPVLSIITGEAADMTETSVVLNGYSSIPFADLGSLTVGFIYSTASEPSLSNGTNVISEEFLSDTQFFVSISGLKPDTKYYYRSYLLQNGMYLYGSVSSFSTEKINAVVTTNSPQGVLEHSATISGHLSLTSLSNLKSEVALYYSHLYTTQADLFSKGTRLPESALSVSKDGTFSIDLTNLPHSYSYAYMAYANIEGVDFFGEILQFKTKDIEADIQTGDASNISEHKATISGRFSLKSSTSSKPSVYFFYSDQYSSPDLLKTRGNKALITSIPSDGSFSKNLTDLSYATTYYYMVYVEVEDVQFYGEVRSFNTSGIEASITTLNATNVTEHKATLSGNFVNRTVDHLNANVALFYSPTISDKDGLARSGKKMIVSSSSIKSNGDFSCDLSNLSHSTTYYYVAYAKIEDVELFGEVESFSTRTVSGTATTGDARDISEHKATITGTVVSNTIETISTSVSVYYSPTLKTKNELVKSGDKMSVSSLDSDGDFSCKLLNLSHSTTYYYVTFAKIEDVEILGDVKSFSTRGISGTATTGTATDITEHKATISGSFVLNSVESLQSEVYLYYSSTAKTESELKTTGTSIKVTNLSSNGQISVNLENLAHSTTYYYMISSSVEGVCFDGEIKRFITTAINATVTTGAASDVDEFSAKITGGFLASNSSLRHGVYVVYGENLTSREKLMNSGTSLFYS